MSSPSTALARLRRDGSVSRIALVAAAVVVAALLLIVAVNRLAVPSDEHAYWLAAQLEA